MDIAILNLLANKGCFSGELLILLILSGCAAMGPPGGGPEDKEPPEIVYVEPASGTTHVDPNTPIYVMFSEPVTAASLSEALYITPPTAKKPRIKVTGSQIRITLPDPIPSDQTLVITIGSGVSDLRRNQMDESISIALTAGDRISSGKISGKVFVDKDPKGILVSAWNVNDSLELNPTEQLAPLMTQTDMYGNYVLDYLSEGTYRIICWDDQDRDRLLDMGKDRIGIGWDDVVLERDSIAMQNLFPVAHDTTRLRPLLFSAQDNRHMSVRFAVPAEERADEIMETARIEGTSSELEVIDSWWSSADSSQLIYLTAPQIEGEEYLFHMQGDTLPLSCIGSAMPDTVGPRVNASYPETGTKNVAGKVEGWIGFDDKIIVDDRDSSLFMTVSDSLDEKIAVWQNEPHILRWTVSDPIQAGSAVQLSLNVASLSDYTGNFVVDSVWNVEFTIYNPSEMGSITGSMIGVESETVVVVASQIERRSKRFQTTVAEDKSFSVEHLPEGNFILWAFLDEDADGVYGHGNLNPFRYSERFAIHPDTVQVRARWETGGVIFKFSE